VVVKILKIEGLIGVVLQRDSGAQKTNTINHLYYSSHIPKSQAHACPLCLGFWAFINGSKKEAFQPSISANVASACFPPKQELMFFFIVF